MKPYAMGRSCYFGQWSTRKRFNMSFLKSDLDKRKMLYIMPAILTLHSLINLRTPACRGICPHPLIHMHGKNDFLGGKLMSRASV